MAELKIKRSYRLYRWYTIFMTFPVVLSFTLRIDASPNMLTALFAAEILLYLMLLVFISRRKKNNPYEYIIDDHEIRWYGLLYTSKYPAEKFQLVRLYRLNLFCLIDNRSSFYLSTWNLSKADAQMMFDFLQQRIVRQTS